MSIGGHGHGYEDSSSAAAAAAAAAGKQLLLLQLLHQPRAVLLLLLLLLRLVKLPLLQHLQEMLLQQLLLLHQHPSTLALLQLQLPLQDEAEIRSHKLCQPNGQPMCCLVYPMKHMKKGCLARLCTSFDEQSRELCTPIAACFSFIR